MPVVDANGTPLVQDTNERAREALRTLSKDGVDSAPALAKQCLEDFVWLWEESLEHRPSFVGVRSSFLLGKFRDLAAIHPPAADYLEQQAERITRLIENKRATAKDVRDLAALQQTRGKQDDTVSSMRTLMEHQPELAAAVGAHLWRTWVQTESWDLFERFPPVFEELTSILRAVTEKTPPEVRQLAKTHPEMLETISANSGFPSFDAIVNAYKMSGQKDLAQQLLERESELRAY